MQNVASKVAKHNNVLDVKRVLYEVVYQMEDSLFNEEEDEDPAFRAFFHTNAGNYSNPSNDTPDIEIPADVFYQKMAAARESARLHPMDLLGIFESRRSTRRCTLAYPNRPGKATVKMRMTQRPIRPINVARRRRRQANMHQDLPKQV
jgi:hypothetical protein